MRTAAACRSISSRVSTWQEGQDRQVSGVGQVCQGWVRWVRSQVCQGRVRWVRSQVVERQGEVEHLLGGEGRHGGQGAGVGLGQHLGGEEPGVGVQQL